MHKKWKTIKFDKKVKLNANQEYAIAVMDDKVTIKKIIGWDGLLGQPILGETIYESK